MVHGEEGQGLEKWGPINTTLNSLPFRALQLAFKFSGLLFWCPFSQSHQILSHNCICSFKIFLAVLFWIFPPGTKKFCKPAVKMQRVFTLYHAKMKVLIFLCCFENCKHMGILRGLKNIRMTRKMQTIVVRSRSEYSKNWNEEGETLKKLTKKKKKEVLQLSHYLNKAAQISCLTCILRKEKVSLAPQ